MRRARALLVVAVPSAQATPHRCTGRRRRSSAEGVDSGGRRTLDGGPVDAGSLGAAGAGVTWTVAGAQRSATLG